MRAFLLIIGIIFLAFWAIGLFFKLFGAAIHIVLVIAVIVLLYIWLRPAAKNP